MIRHALAVVLVAIVMVRPAAAEDWPQFRGPNRDGRSAETGLLKEWPEGGPELLWKYKGIGMGWSSATVVGEDLYVTGMEGETEYLFALDTEGEFHWKAPIGRGWVKGWSGTRGSVAVDGDRLYAMTGQCEVVCMARADGEAIWSVDSQEVFGTVMLGYWGNAESLLVDGDRVICTPGGPAAGIVALDKMTGETVWICEELSDRSGQCSPIVIEWGGRRLIVTLTASALIAVDPESGELLWRYERNVQHGVNAVSPVHQDGRIFLTSGYGGARKPAAPDGGRAPAGESQLPCEMVEMAQDGLSVEQKWIKVNEGLDVQHGGVVLHEGHVYGASDVQERGNWLCVDLATGKHAAEIEGVGKGSVIYADGMLYGYGEKGTVGLINASPTDFRMVSSFKIPSTFEARGQHWAHPTIADGRLYIRYADTLRAYDIKAR